MVMVSPRCLHGDGVPLCPQVTEDLRRQLERLQLFRLEVEQPGEGWGRAQARAREVQLEVKRLQQVSLHEEHLRGSGGSGL